MTQPHDIYELLMRYLDGNVTQQEIVLIEDHLRGDPAARKFLIDSAEQAMMIADVERIVHETELMTKHGECVVPLAGRSASVLSGPTQLLRWPWGVAMTSCLVALLSLSAYAFKGINNPTVARVSKVTGASQYYGASGQSNDSLEAGRVIHVGDFFESRSCDSWITLTFEDNASMTIAGNSAIRVQQSPSNENHFELQRGSLWYSPSSRPSNLLTIVQSPTLSVVFRNALLNIQTSASETIVRVHSGTAQIQRRRDGKTVDVEAGEQIFVKLDDRQDLVPEEQPIPIDHWSSQLMKGSEVLLGNWLPPAENEPVRLGASPLLWPVPDREPVMLYATAIAAWRCSERPVLLHADSKLRFRGRTERPETVRLGFSVQKMHGVFAGKFEIDIPASHLGPVGEYWDLELSLSDFRPLHPQLASSPEGHELTDVYALTLLEDAGLEITQIDLLPRAQ